MKILFILFFSIFILSNCSSQTKDSISIEYKAATRGSKISLLANSEKIVYTSYDKNLELTISKQQWNEITDLVLKIELGNMENIISPSTESHIDRALIASLTIHKKGVVYVSSTFDHGNPPKELLDLINLLFKLIY